MNQIITIISDWGEKDAYAAIFKAALLSQSRDLQIVDITHHVKENNILNAVFHLNMSYHHFPKDTVHIVDVTMMGNGNLETYLAWMRASNKTQEKDFFFTDKIAFRYRDHYFLCENNGLVSLFCEEISEIEEVVLLTRKNTPPHLTFDALDFYPYPATLLAQGAKLQDIGESYPLQKIEKVPNAIQRGLTIKDDLLIFSVQHIDSHGNIITNLKKDTFEEVAKGRKRFLFYNNVNSCRDKVAISKNYNHLRSGDNIVLLFGLHGFLEIALKNDSLIDFYSCKNRNFQSWKFTIDFNIGDFI